MSAGRVAVVIDEAVQYPSRGPFHPPRAYPELAGVCDAIDPENRVYERVRQTFELLGLDAPHAGTPAWNPLGGIVRPGDRVVIKPNMVLHFHGESENIDAIVTHGSVVRPIVDYCLRALEGRGEIVIGDAPHGNADFGKIARNGGYASLVEWYASRSMPVRLVDFRKHVYGYGPDGFEQDVRREMTGDPAGYRLVDLGRRSFLETLPNLKRLYGSDYDRTFIVNAHRSGHRYLVSGSVLDADVVISVPKMKTHKKTGVTLNMKNLVGINGDKNHLAHYRVGPPSQGGDEYPDAPSLGLRAFRRWERFGKDHLLAPNTTFGRRAYRALNAGLHVVRGLNRDWLGEDLPALGNWEGNDTAWRMCLDLNDILLYADKKGVLTDAPQRRLFSVVDGILAGEGNGPMNPSPRAIGYVAAGEPMPVDFVCCRHMGFEWKKLPLMVSAASCPRFVVDPDAIDVRVRRNDVDVDSGAIDFRFATHPAWPSLSPTKNRKV